jgi:hypothetical protein
MLKGTKMKSLFLLTVATLLGASAILVYFFPELLETSDRAEVLSLHTLLLWRVPSPSNIRKRWEQGGGVGACFVRLHSCGGEIKLLSQCRSFGLLAISSHMASIGPALWP